tara:strand:+ start:204 stop:905 length:702 start_codon:yes stop_codon:yes gene_type:complete
VSDSPRNLFLNNLSNWEQSIPLQSQWIIQIQPQSGSISSLYQAILGQEDSGTTLDLNQFKISPNIAKRVFGESGSNTNSQTIGCFYAQEVGLPQESFSSTDATLVGAGGFLTGIVGGDRLQNSQRNFNIGFLETNLDFIDGIIKPWIIAGAYRGLIARSGNKNIKCNIKIVQFTKNFFEKKRPARKMHEFFDCIPRNVQSPPPLRYDEPTSVNIMNVDWSYNSYSYKLLPQEQ